MSYTFRFWENGDKAIAINRWCKLLQQSQVIANKKKKYRLRLWLGLFVCYLSESFCHDKKEREPLTLMPFKPIANALAFRLFWAKIIYWQRSTISSGTYRNSFQLFIINYHLLRFIRLLVDALFDQIKFLTMEIFWRFFKRKSRFLVHSNGSICKQHCTKRYSNGKNTHLFIFIRRNESHIY